MTTALAIVVLLVALACPLHMLWSHRRQRRAICCPAVDESLQARQRRLAAQVDRASRSA